MIVARVITDNAGSPEEYARDKHRARRGMASMAYSTADIRNIALVGQAGAGKTLLAESLLTESGAIRSRGSLERGTTVCDFDRRSRSCAIRSTPPWCISTSARAG
jgi:ABC-type glutathione transport system ATPase component